MGLLAGTAITAVSVSGDEVSRILCEAARAVHGTMNADMSAAPCGGLAFGGAEAPLFGAIQLAASPDAEPGSVAATFSVSDPNGGPVDVSLVGSGASFFEISGDEIVAGPGSMPPGTYDLALRAVGANGDVAISEPIVIEIPNSPPLFGSVVLAGGQDGAAGSVVATFTVSDPNGDAVSVALGGPDAWLFSLSGGAVMVGGADLLTGSYDIEIVATDATGAVATRPLTVDIAAPATVVAEMVPNFARTDGSVIAGLGVEGRSGAFSYSLGGPDADFFRVSGSDLVAGPDGVRPRNYVIDVVATDLDGVAVAQTLTITVPAINCPYNGFEAGGGYCYGGTALVPQRVIFQKPGDRSSFPATWQGAQNICANSTAGGYNDWRLPAQREAQYGLTFMVNHPAYNSLPTWNTYWTGDNKTSASGPDAYYVIWENYFGSYYRFQIYFGSKGAGRHVVCVRDPYW